MSESSSETNVRAFFQKGQQRKFLESVETYLDCSAAEVAKLAGVHTRTLNDWKREQYSMPMCTVLLFSKKACIPLPKSIVTKDQYWYTRKGGHRGGRAVFAKYGFIGGDQEHRKQKWQQWWEREGRFRKDLVVNASGSFRKPPKSRQLAEFVGILLGDGGLSIRQITITLHKTDDKKYSQYVCGLMEELFSVPVALHESRTKNAIDIIISRTGLVSHFIEMGIPVGSKTRNQTTVPQWICDSKEYTTYCTRGLFDTDGCFYVDKHSHKGVEYINGAMNFTNRSLPLLHFFKTSLECNGLQPVQTSAYCIALRREGDIRKYFQLFKTSNPKHQQRFREYLKMKKGGVPKRS